jgi:hypothetical protein
VTDQNKLTGTGSGMANLYTLPPSRNALLLSRAANQKTEPPPVCRRNLAGDSNIACQNPIARALRSTYVGASNVPFSGTRVIHS